MNPVLKHEMTARERVDASLAAIEAVDGKVRSFVQVTPELAYEAADRVDARISAGETDQLGPLAGVPVSFKDNMNLIGSKMTCCSRMLENFESVYTATAVQRMLDAGALPIGKVNMDEFAFGSSTESSVFGATHNPWNLDCVPGGSSGGSAASVAAGIVPISLGSDTGGSIRQPGAFTGTVALKPTYGRVSRYGVTAFASSLDQVGPIANTVADVALALNVIAGHDPMDATSVKREDEDFATQLDQGAKGLRVALATDFLEMDGLDPVIKKAVLDSAAALEREGAQIGEVTLPNSEYALSTYYILSSAEASSNLARLDGMRYGRRVEDATDVLDLYLRSRSEGFGPETIRRIIIGTYALSAGYYDAYYGQAQKARTIIRQDFDRAFADYDIILAPTTPVPAFKIGEKLGDPLAMYLSDVFTIPINLAGITALSLPVGLSADRLPIGVQMMANHFDEATLLRAASALERLVDFTERPPHSAGAMG
jgi:aspartyl-tRNA(Asn)/glutamyl-tRNA(Gln) amidotransferase subunit A